MKKVKIAYIGGGSKMWARVFMNDLALDSEINGEIALYDIDTDAAIKNKLLGNIINNNKQTRSKWNYYVTENIEQCLFESTFVIISILPGTFKEMQSDVHHPEKYNIYQTVGDTVGPGGILRAMRTVPLYEYFAYKIKEICPDAWVINFTNPMSICVKTLYDVFPNIKAIGCCHEVFHAQEFLAMVLEEELSLKNRPSRKEINIDVAGINHFTWITEARYKDENNEEIQIFPLINNFISKHFEEGIYEGTDKFKFKYNTYAYGNKVKMDLFIKYNILAAAGDRHLVEFLNNNWYLKSKEDIKRWAISITPVESRINDMHIKIKDRDDIISGNKELVLNKSSEEAVDIMKALLGIRDLKTNVNFPNKGQIEELPTNSIVESNCIITKDNITPVKSKSLGVAVTNLVLRNLLNIENLYVGIKNRDLKTVFQSFINQPLCSNLSFDEAISLYREMINNTKEYLIPYFDISKLDEIQ